MHTVLKNPFFDSAASLFTADKVAAPITSPCAPGAATDPIHSSCGGVEGHAGTLAFQRDVDGRTPPNGSNEQVIPSAGIKPGPQDLLGSDISDVSHIFDFARMLCAQARVRPGTISQEVVGVCEEITAYEDVYDPPPLFLRTA